MQTSLDKANTKDLIISHLCIALEECDKLNAKHAAIDISMAIEKMIEFLKVICLT